jgi:hypothetical protein
MIRPAAVAGRFYPENPALLRQEIDSFLSPPDEHKTPVRACMVPHAGYKYSGRVAGEVYRRIEIPARVILIGPRHFPRGAPMAILSGGWWRTPLGLCPVDSALAERIAVACPLLREDAVAHSDEHSIEVHLPFLQVLAPGFSFVPIVIGAVQYSHLASLGHALSEVIRADSEPVLLIASSDMNHYESDEVTRVKDRKAIARILALEPHELFELVRNDRISMCGYGAAVVMLVAIQELGAGRADLVRYATSGEINGDLQEVVGYAGIVIA